MTTGNKLYILRVDIYESKLYPVVRHEFIGKTKNEAKAYFKAHLETDDFLYNCYIKRKFKNFKCKTKFKWRESNIL